MLCTDTFTYTISQHTFYTFNYKMYVFWILMLCLLPVVSTLNRCIFLCDRCISIYHPRHHLLYCCDTPFISSTFNLYVITYNATHKEAILLNSHSTTVSMFVQSKQKQHLCYIRNINVLQLNSLQFNNGNHNDHQFKCVADYIPLQDYGLYNNGELVLKFNFLYDSNGDYFIVRYKSHLYIYYNGESQNALMELRQINNNVDQYYTTIKCFLYTLYDTHSFSIITPNSLKLTMDINTWLSTPGNYEPLIQYPITLEIANPNDTKCYTMYTEIQVLHYCFSFSLITVPHYNECTFTCTHSSDVYQLCSSIYNIETCLLIFFCTDGYKLTSRDIFITATNSTYTVTHNKLPTVLYKYVNNVLHSTCTISSVTFNSYTLKPTCIIPSVFIKFLITEEDGRVLIFGNNSTLLYTTHDINIYNNIVVTIAIKKVKLLVLLDTFESVTTCYTSQSTFLGRY